MKFKILFFTLFLAFGLFGQVENDSIVSDTTIVEFEEPNIEEVANEVLKVLTRDSTAVVQLPDSFDPSNPDSVFQWWMFIFALLMPLGTWLFHKFWPSSTKSELILKSTSIAVIVLLIIIFYKGASVLVIGQAVLAFIMKVVGYKNFLKPVAKSPRLSDYDNSK